MGVRGVFLPGWPLRASTSEPWRWTRGAVFEGLKKLASSSAPALTGAAALFISAPTAAVWRWSRRGIKKKTRKTCQEMNEKNATTVIIKYVSKNQKVIIVNNPCLNAKFRSH